ncbi:MAG: efflux RND transporter periplasmic adaptor subunit [Pseudomonadota bacterium]
MSGMDRKVERRGWPARLWVPGTGVGILAAVVLFQFWQSATTRSYSVPRDRVTVSAVRHGTFEDVIPVRGTVQPRESVFLDAVDGGVVDEVLVEEGSFVEQGQPLIRLSNTDLRLNVARNDTSITEQINNLSNIANSLERTKLATEREVIDLRYRITALERQKRQYESLRQDQLVSDEQYRSVLDELAYRRDLLQNTLQRQALEERIRTERRDQIETQMEKLESNLAVAQRSYENLVVRAPISGRLTALSARVGENKARGERLGQIDGVDDYKIEAEVDEYYVTRVTQGQTARFRLAGQSRTARISRVYPEIANNVFTVDLQFGDSQLPELRRGQSLQLDLVLGQPTETLLLPLGGFMQETAGNWVYVLQEDGTTAVRRDIETGRRNNRMIEVRQGLEAGDAVITSRYEAFSDYAEVRLTD